MLGIDFMFTRAEWAYHYKSGADPVIFKRGVPTTCPNSKPLIIHTKGGSNPWNPPLDPALELYTFTREETVPQYHQIIYEYF